MYNKKEIRDSHGHSVTNTLSAKYETHTAKRNTEMQDSECPTLRDMNIYIVIHTDIYLKNLLLQNEAALKQQRWPKHSNNLTFQEFQASTNIQSCKSKQLYLKN